MISTILKCAAADLSRWRRCKSCRTSTCIVQHQEDSSAITSPWNPIEEKSPLVDTQVIWNRTFRRKIHMKKTRVNALYRASHDKCHTLLWHSLGLAGKTLPVSKWRQFNSWSWLFIQNESWRSRIFSAFHWIENHRISSECKYLGVTLLSAWEIFSSLCLFRHLKRVFHGEMDAMAVLPSFDISLSCALCDLPWSYCSKKRPQTENKIPRNAFIHINLPW